MVRINKNSASGGQNKSTDSPFVPVSATKLFQEGHGLLLLVPGVGGVGARSQPTKDFASGDPNDSDGALFAPVSAPQGLKEIHDRHIFYTPLYCLNIASTVDFFGCVGQNSLSFV